MDKQFTTPNRAADFAPVLAETNFSVHKKTTNHSSHSTITLRSSNKNKVFPSNISLQMGAFNNHRETVFELLKPLVHLLLKFSFSQFLTNPFPTPHSMLSQTLWGQAPPVPFTPSYPGDVGSGDQTLDPKNTHKEDFTWALARRRQSCSQVLRTNLISAIND